MDNDNFNEVPSNISSVIDLLEDKGISWGHYQEDMPYTGFEGFAWVNQQTHKNDYVRKHGMYNEVTYRNESDRETLDPAIIYESVTENPNRLANIKNLTMFYNDLANDKLPQWMFITPNMSKWPARVWLSDHRLKADSKRWARHVRDHGGHMDQELCRASTDQPKFHEEDACAHYV